jgi:hypothetical protein
MLNFHIPIHIIISGGKGKHLCVSIFQKCFFECPIFPKEMGLANKSGFYKQTKLAKKNLIKKGCTPQQINETTRIGTYAL